VRCFSDNEKLVGIDIDLGHLLGMQGILHRKWMQVKHDLKRGHFFGRGVEKTDPRKLVVTRLNPSLRKSERFVPATIAVNV